MTRWARANPQKQSLHEASSWKQLKQTKHQIKATGVKSVFRNKRKEHLKIKQDRKKDAKELCFHCRMRGHGMADCPVLKDESEHVFKRCRKCGSTEHKTNLCSAKLSPGQELTYAKCFICGQMGHLSMSCPDNPRGLYPDGGCCPLCHSVEHFKKDCPERKVRSQVSLYTLCSMDNSKSVDDEMALYEDAPDKKKALPKPKIVKF